MPEVKVVAEADGVTLDDHYTILWSQLDTPEKILAWIWHLSFKTWITQDAIHTVIDFATEKANIKLPCTMDTELPPTGAQLPLTQRVEPSEN